MPDSRAKPLSLIEGHRTKAELAARAAGEKALSSTEKMKAPAGAAKNKAAYAHWKRILQILAGVELNEAFYERVIWRYCLLLAEHDQLTVERETRADDLEHVRAEKSGAFDGMEPAEYYALLDARIRVLDLADKAVAKKRDQLLAIEKENLMTVQGKLRAVPKKPDKEKPSGIAAFRQARSG